MRLRGIIARQRYLTAGGEHLLVGRRVQFVKRDGGNQPLTLGRNVRIANWARVIFEGPGGKIELGDDVFLNERCEIRARELVRVGSHCRVAFDVVVMDTNHHDLDGTTTTSPTVLGERVWVGARALILRGVTVGDGAVIAAGSIVTRDVPPRALVAGNPAKIIRREINWR